MNLCILLFHFAVCLLNDVRQTLLHAVYHLRDFFEVRVLTCAEFKREAKNRNAQLKMS